VTQVASSLESLFYAGAHAEVLRRTVDSTSGQFDERDTFLVVGALVFAGRSEEAATVFRAWEREQPAENDGVGPQKAACRFFLCVAECRAGRYAAAERLCRVSLKAQKHNPGARTRFYLHQGLGLVRYFSGSIANAARHAARARRYALEARFPYGRMLALDLLGHALVHRGTVLSGLTILEQAAELAEGIGLGSFARTTRAATLAYRAYFGTGEKDPTPTLRAHLEQLGDADRYSRRLVLTEIATAHAFRGEADAAALALREVEAVALPDGDRRAKVRLYLTYALLAGLSRGDEAAEEWLERAAALLDAEADAALQVEVCWYEHLLCPRLFQRRARAELDALARRTGIARANYLRAVGRPGHAMLPTEDRFADLLHGLRGGNADLDKIVAHGLLGLLPHGLGVAPATRVVFDVPRQFFAIEQAGNVSQREMPSEGVLALLRAIASGVRSKEELVNDVWRLKVYRPERHDAMVHTAVSRLRKALEPHVSWVVQADNGYVLAPQVSLLEIGGPVAPRGPIPGEVFPPARAKSDDRRARIVVLARRPQGVVTREVCDLLHISEASALRVLGAMTAEGELERTGQGRSTRYTSRT